MNQVGGHWPAEDADADDRMGIGDAACTFSNTYSTLLFKIPQVPLHVPILCKIFLLFKKINNFYVHFINVN